MQIKNSTERYGAIARLLHWSVSLLVIGLLAVGLIMTEMEFSPDTLKLYGLHKSFGIIVLTLMTLRLIWRLMNTRPELPKTIEEWQARAAKATHWLFYALLFAMPLTGWLMSSAAGFPVSVFGLPALPDLVAPNKELGEIFEEAHELIGYSLIGLIVLHISAALMHHFYYKDGVLATMLPLRKKPK